MECDSFAELKRPDRQIIIGFSACRKLGDQNAASANLDQVVAQLPLEVLHELSFGHLRIKRLPESKVPIPNRSVPPCVGVAARNG